MIRFRQRFLVAAWKRLHFYVAARKRQRFLVADCICALATASVLSLLLTSCAHTRYIPLPESHQRDSLSKSVNVLVNTTYVDRTHTLTQRGDTIFKTDSIYVEKFTDVEVHDTITVTHRDSIPYPVEVPVDVPTPIPRFYHFSAWFTILAIVLFIFYVFLRIYLHR